MKFKTLPNGNLEITCEEDEKADLQEVLDRVTHRDHGFLAEILEYTGWQSNGQIFQVQPEWVSALTESPILTDDILYDLEDSPTVSGTVWWFPNYQVESFAETLIRDGRVVFTAAQKFE